MALRRWSGFVRLAVQATTFCGVALVLWHWRESAQLNAVVSSAGEDKAAAASALVAGWDAANRHHGQGGPKPPLPGEGTPEAGGEEAVAAAEELAFTAAVDVEGSTVVDAEAEAKDASTLDEQGAAAADAEESGDPAAANAEDFSDSAVVDGTAAAAGEVEERPPAAKVPTGSAANVETAGGRFGGRGQRPSSPGDSDFFRVYVSKLPNRFNYSRLIQRYPVCKSFQWSNEYRLVRRLSQGVRRTYNVNEADYVLVPFLSKCWYNNVAKYRLDTMDADVKEIVASLNKTEAWRRHPEKHLFLFVSGAGPTLFRSWRMIRGGTFILAEGDRAADIFIPHRDIIIPGVSAVNAPPATRDPFRPRRLLASFRGNLVLHMRDSEGKDRFMRSLLRAALVQLAKNRKDVVVGDRIYDEIKRTTYKTELEVSTFCLVPRGVTPWTRRLFDVLLSDCIPVVLANSIVFPFEDTINYEHFTLKIPEAWVGNLWTLLEGISAKQVKELQTKVREMAPYFSASRHFSPIDAVLKELATTRQHIKSGTVQNSSTRNGPNTFWMPGRGVFHVQGNEARQVGPSYGGGAVPHPPEKDLWKPDARFKNLLGGNLKLEADPPSWWLKYKAPAASAARDKPCAAGYEHVEGGDVAGHGMTWSKRGENHVKNMNDCAKLCDESRHGSGTRTRSTCSSFEWRVDFATPTCYLNRESDPTRISPEIGSSQVFCKKVASGSFWKGLFGDGSSRAVKQP